MKSVKILYLVVFVFVLSLLNTNAQELKISDLKVSSGKDYLVKYNSFADEELQYIDRTYLYDRVPKELKGATVILPAGNDKMYEEQEVCFTFSINKKAVVHVLYADKYPVLPVWLNDYTKTKMKVYRNDSSEETMKGIFTVYSKEFEPGEVQINGCLGKGIKTPEFVAMKGCGYCMYSVVVQMAN